MSGEITYALAGVGPGLPVVVTGHQVGFFAVRACLRGETARHESTGRVVAMAGFAVDHWPSGVCVISVPTAERAWQIADELSVVTNGAEESDAATTADALIKQLGPSLISWIAKCGGRDFVRFRDWQRARRAA